MLARMHACLLWNYFAVFTLFLVFLFLSPSKLLNPWVDPGQGRVTAGPDPPSLKYHKSIGFLSNTGLEPLKTHKAETHKFNFGPSLARQRNAI